jgi:hypothetical protein
MESVAVVREGGVLGVVLAYLRRVSIHILDSFAVARPE